MKKLLLVVSLLIVSLASAFPANGAALINTSSPIVQPGRSELSATAAQPQSGLSYRYAATFGTSGVPYLDSPGYLNNPGAMVMDASNNLYLVESQGNRILKYGPTGNLLMAIGKAGVCDVLCHPSDLALDGSGNIWVVGGYGLLEFAPDGHLLRTVTNNESGEPVGFSNLSGIVFNSQGHMFLSDSNHHRVLVYTFSGDTMVYNATIGATNQSGTDNGHFNDPTSLGVDTSDRLYVVDQNNIRVQRCSLSGGGWSCTLFAIMDDGGYGFHISVDGNNNVYITDPRLNWVMMCPGAASCSDLINTDLLVPRYVVADSGGNIFVAYEDHTIRKYNPSGAEIGIFAGVSGVPYLTDEQHLYAPDGIAMDANDDFAVIAGKQLIKMDTSGARVWAYGVPGVSVGPGTLFMPAGLNVDASGKFYVAAQLSIEIINSNGTYANTLGTGCCGGEYGFFFTHGVGIDWTTGTIYASDTGTNRVQVYGSDLVYQDSMGESGVSGSDNAHFNDPEAITVDQAGNIYVVDAGNMRIQKFNSARVYQKTFTYTHEVGNLVVDSQGRLFVADGNRVYVYDADGNYLTTIGGKDLGKDQQDKTYVAVDSAGSVYIASQNNDCVVKYVPGTPDWQQVNISGFNTSGAGYGGTYSMEVFDGSLYAGGYENSAAIWRLAGGQLKWQAFNPAWASSNEAVMKMQAYGAYLYAGTSNQLGGEIWRTNGTTWEQVVLGGFNDANNNAINVLAAFGDHLYAATSRNDGVAQIWRSASGDAGSWSQVVVGGGFSSGGIASDMTMDVYNGALYLGLGRSNVAELWKTTNGTDWTPVFTNGLGASNTHVSSMAVFNGKFYIGMRNITAGGSLWRSSNGIDFTPVFTDGLGSLANGRLYGLTVYAGQLYLTFSNPTTGAEVWRSADGTAWTPIAANGWGDPGNVTSSYFDKGMVVFEDYLHISTLGNAGGGQVWRYNQYDVAPGLATVLPAQGRADQPNDLHLYGLNFTAGTTVTLGTTPPEALPVQFVSSTELIASVPAGTTPGVYSLMLQNPNSGVASFSGVYAVIAPITVDLSATAFGFWTNPVTLVEGQPMQVGLVVHREGGSSPLANVKVRFYNGDPASGGILIGDGTIPTMGQSGDFSTSAVSWTGATPGGHTLFAIIDPDNAVNETNETNNIIGRQVTVQAPTIDQIPPTVASFTINNGAQQTNSPTIALNTIVSDPFPSSGVAYVMYYEYIYSQGSGQWIQVRTSPWLPYNASHANYPWTLVPDAGMHYLLVWGSDRAGNVSQVPGGAYINYLPPSQPLVQGQMRVYRYNLIAGQQFTATLTPFTGDSDLYVWPSSGAPWKSDLSGTSVDAVSFTVPSSGVYQVEVYAYTATTYSLAVNLNGSGLFGLHQNLLPDPSKPIPTSPMLPVSSKPEQQAGLPAAPVISYSFNQYLPSLRK